MQELNRNPKGVSETVSLYLPMPLPLYLPVASWPSLHHPRGLAAGQVRMVEGFNAVYELLDLITHTHLVLCGGMGCMGGWGWYGREGRGGMGGWGW